MKLDKDISKVTKAVTPYHTKYYHVDEEPKEVMSRIHWVQGLIKKGL